MKALVFNGPWDMEIQDRAVRPPGPSDAVVEIVATGICGSDIHGFAGHTGRRHAGQVMGHETVGRVVDVGNRAPANLMGSLVTINPVLACGRCASCHAGRQQICEQLKVLGVAPELDAAFAEYTTVPAANLVRLPAGMTARHGALVEPLAVGYHAALRGEAYGDDRVFVIGGGPIGQAAALAARRLGVHDIVVAEPDGLRRAALERLGFTSLAPGDIADQLHTVLGGAATLVLDAVGVDSTLADALTMSTPRARIVLIGMAAPQITLSSYALSVSERTIVGSFCYAAGHFRETVEWAADNESVVDLLLDFARPLEDGPETFRQLADGSLQANKVLLVPERSQ